MSAEEKPDDAQSWRSSYVLLYGPFGDWDNRERRRCTRDTVLGHGASPSQHANAAPAFTVQLLLLHRSGTSGSNLTFESEEGFPADSSRASLAHENRNFHHSQAQ